MILKFGSNITALLFAISENLGHIPKFGSIFECLSYRTVTNYLNIESTFQNVLRFRFEVVTADASDMIRIGIPYNHK